MTGKHEPNRRHVQALELVLQLKRGSLSRLLGWLPVDAVPIISVTEAIAHDPRLTPQNRQAVLAVYETMVTETQAVRRARALRSQREPQ